MAYGQTGSADSTIVNPAPLRPPRCDLQLLRRQLRPQHGRRTIIEVKWLYTEFELPLIPVPTVARIGAQPFGAAANYKLAVVRDR